MVKKIDISTPKFPNAFAFVDDADFAALTAGPRWRCAKFNKKLYAARSVRRNGKAGMQLMHREILKAQEGEQTDHINSDGLDNRRANLRLCTVAQNQKNQIKNSKNTSGYKGVHWFKPRGYWCAQITVDGKTKTIGYFRAIEDAARAYDEAAIALHGRFARTNAMIARELNEKTLPRA